MLKTNRTVEETTRANYTGKKGFDMRRIYAMQCSGNRWKILNTTRTFQLVDHDVMTSSTNLFLLNIAIKNFCDKFVVFWVDQKHGAPAKQTGSAWQVTSHCGGGREDVKGKEPLSFGEVSCFLYDFAKQYSQVVCCRRAKKKNVSKIAQNHHHIFQQVISSKNIFHFSTTAAKFQRWRQQPSLNTRTAINVAFTFSHQFFFAQFLMKSWSDFATKQKNRCFDVIVWRHRVVVAQYMTQSATSKI